MKKLIGLITFSLIVSPLSAKADTVLIVDGNNVVRQQIYTQPMGSQTVQTTAPAYYYPPQQVVVQQPAQQVIVQQPVQEVVVVRPTPRPRSYYYDSTATALFAGFTGAVIGHTLFGHHHGPRHPAPRHGGPHRR